MNADIVLQIGMIEPKFRPGMQAGEEKARKML